MNRLIEGLAPNKRQRLLGWCEQVELVSDDVLCEHDEPYRYAYFPIGGIISLVTIVGRYRPLEMGLIGNEGMLGATLVLGVKVAPTQAIVQSAGAAWRARSGMLVCESVCSFGLCRCGGPAPIRRRAFPSDRPLSRPA